MFHLLTIVFQSLVSLAKGNTFLAAENIALRHQLLVLQRQKKPQLLKNWDRLLWMFLSKVWSQWRSALFIVKPEPVIRWHRTLFKRHWSRKSSRKSKGRPPLSAETKKLIREIANAKWTANVFVDTFPWDTAPRYLLRDRDSIYGKVFKERVKEFGVKEVVTAFKSPWQNGYVERLMGSIRRECLDHMIILNEQHLRSVLKNYFQYYHEDRTHLGLEKDTPKLRVIEERPEDGEVLKEPRLGGLHHRYRWRKAA